MSERKLTRREQAEQLLQEPNIRRYLDVLAYAEGTEKHGYYTKFGGSRIDNLNWHPNKFWGRTGDGNTSATGRYQFLKDTWQEQSKKLGLKDFGGHSQDLAAVSLIMERGAINDILNGDIDNANRKLSSIWASLPYHNSKHQPRKTSEQVLQKWEQLGGKEYVIPKQQYDYSTTPDIPQAQRQTIDHTPTNFKLPETEVPSFNSEIFNAFSLGGPAGRERGEQPITQWDNDFVFDTQALTDIQISETQVPTFTPPKQSYSAELAQAFGVLPKGADNGLGGYLNSLVESIYNEAD